MNPIRRLPLLLISLLCLEGAVPLAAGPVNFVSRSPIYGRWDGSLSSGDKELELSLDFIDGGALLDIPSQMLYGFPIEKVEYGAGSSVKIELPNSSPLEIDAVFAKDGITGSFTQGTTTGEVSLKPVSSEPSDGATYAMDTGKGILFGSLIVPAGATRPIPIVLIVAGSGPTNRDGNNFTIPGKNDSLKLLARGLADAGIASLRYDKRGVGESFPLVKSEADLLFDDYIDDATNLVKALKADSRFSKVIVVGHSEGSMIGADAARAGAADKFVSVSAAGFPMSDVLMQQLKDQSDGQDEAQRTAMLKESAAIIDALKNGKTVDAVSDSLMDLFRPSVQPYFISWFKHDPRSELALLKIPVLIIQGDTDLQVQIQDADSLKAAKSDAAYAIIKGMNHVLKNSPADAEGNYATYSDPSLPLSDGFVKAISDFILK